MTKRHIDPRDLVWICRPQLYLLSSDKVVLETEPFTDLKPAGKSAEAIELSLAVKGSFCFTMRSDFRYRSQFDQCGMILYEGGKRRAVCGTESRDDAMTSLKCIVYHDAVGDSSKRDIGSNISTMYYRVWYRGGAVRIQYSFTGIRYSDLREFWIDPEKEKTISIGIYACSPGDSWFDCTFSGMMLDEEETERGEADEC
jgi:regulation of enolase protein 1 (concanavalin A-like superfamily)